MLLLKHTELRHTESPSQLCSSVEEMYGGVAAHPRIEATKF
jgi:hypothetical protein